MTWPARPLAEIATIERVGVDPQTLPDDLPYLGLEHIERGGRIIGFETVGEAQLASTKFVFDEGHVLFGKLRPNLGKVARPGFRGVCSTDILPIRPGRHLDRAFLHQYLAQPAMIAFAASRTSGANLPRLSPSVLATFEIPLPPLGEQRRIAAILDQADALHAKRRQALTHLDALVQARLTVLLSNEATSHVELGEVASFFAGGSLPVGENFAGQQGGFLLMKVSDMNRPGNERKITETALWSSSPGARSATCPPGCILLPKRGGAIGTNKKRVSIRPTVLDPNLMAVLPGCDLDLAYLFAWFQRFDLLTISNGSSVPQLNKQDLSPLRIPLPPLALQLEFASIVERADQLATAHRRQLHDMDSLGTAARSLAFRGRL